MTEIKTVTFACIHFTVAFSVAWAVTGSPVIGGVLAVVEPMVNTVAFYLHERVWQRLQRKPSAGSSPVRVADAAYVYC
jgi:uncharacterized membrane protein